MLAGFVGCEEVEYFAGPDHIAQAGEWAVSLGGAEREWDGRGERSGPADDERWDELEL